MLHGTQDWLSKVRKNKICRANTQISKNDGFSSNSFWTRLVRNLRRNIQTKNIVLANIYWDSIRDVSEKILRNTSIHANNAIIHLVPTAHLNQETKAIQKIISRLSIWKSKIYFVYIVPFKTTKVGNLESHLKSIHQTRYNKCRTTLLTQKYV